MRIWKIGIRDEKKVLKKLEQYGTVSCLSVEESRVYEYIKDKEIWDKALNITSTQRKRRRQRQRQPMEGRRKNRSPTPILAETFDRNRDRSRSPILPHREFQTPSPRSDFPRNNIQTPILMPVHNSFNENMNFGVPINVDSNNPNQSNAYPAYPSPENIVANVPRPFLTGSLLNIGNTCYMNAVLYALRFTPNILHNIHHLLRNLWVICDQYDRIRDSPCPKTTATQQLITNLGHFSTEIQTQFQGAYLIDELHRIFAKLSKVERDGDGDALQTYDLQRTVYEFNQVFQPRTQQDSHEFLICIINCLMELSNSLDKLITDHPGMVEQ